MIIKSLLPAQKVFFVKKTGGFKVGKKETIIA
ncbi:hypothetical protein B14911_07925 [Bacillus sp. NRRL B-14911]|uniref:Uncharacterized protein n=1 Tax=Bacillus infantis NRRL B-14911 TaxID=1367477 RepID=U5LDG7_9BACI|nr:hypothetical protein N288_18115 [Bacillus infantis NRRL B-14911]EAR65163.1 hypothetical protein B14911_07925 [Bacillus sp. NRRL B-14911]